MEGEKNNNNWSGQLGFLLAAAGSSIGLGNIWRFPYMTGMNGGGAFVLLYILVVILIGVPLMMAEISLGRAAGANPVRAFSLMTPKKGVFTNLSASLLLLGAIVMLVTGNPSGAVIVAVIGAMFLLLGWKTVGFFCGIVPIILLSYYGVIGGWTLLYIVDSIRGLNDFTTIQGAENVMRPILYASGGWKWAVIIAQLGFMAACLGISLAGVRDGIERWSKMLMPLLFVLMCVLIVRGLTLPGAAKGLRFFLEPDFSKLTAGGVIAAVGQAFFTLSLGMGIMLTYGSYLNPQSNITKATLGVIGLDTLAAVMAGIAIFPAVFAMGFAPSGGPDLTFKVLPAAFNMIPGGMGVIWNVLFFLMLFIAALTSAISLIEPPASILVGELKFNRKAAVVIIVLLCSVIGVICALSMADWTNLPEFGKVIQKIWYGKAPGSFFDTLDSFCCNWILPMLGLATTIYVGWIWGSRNALKELREGDTGALDNNIWLLIAGFKAKDGGKDRRYIFTPGILWGFALRWICPVLVLLAFFNCIGVLKF
ncbi:MAG: sodium-dependent transporter [Lentisphaeria bacterium]|nr:sodium-dependent transporter [Lentisphaeria bacterium]